MFQPGDQVLVVVKEIDDQNRINLSRRRLMADPDLIESAGLSKYLPAELERDMKIAALPESSQPRDRGDRGPRRDSRRDGEHRSSRREFR